MGRHLCPVHRSSGLRLCGPLRARSALCSWPDRRDEARTLFREMFEQAIKASVLPAVDNSFREALQGEPKEADLWTDMMRQTAANFCKDHRRPAAVTLAWECWQLGDQPLASNLLTAALDGIDDENERMLTTLTAVAFLYQTAQHAEADARLRPLLDNDKLAKQPALWRMAGRIADARGLTAHSIECLERGAGAGVRRSAGSHQSGGDSSRLWPVAGSLLVAGAGGDGDEGRSAARSVGEDRPRVPTAGVPWIATNRGGPATTPRRSCGCSARPISPGNTRQLRSDNGPMSPARGWDWRNRSSARATSVWRIGRMSRPSRRSRPMRKSCGTGRRACGRMTSRRRRKKVLRRIVEGDWQSRFGWVRSQARWQLEGR